MSVTDESLRSVAPTLERRDGLDEFNALRKAAGRTKVCEASFPGFTPPTQDRTRRKTELIVAATAYLLLRRSFQDISMLEIATLAGCSVTSIYARFDDKDALLPAVHLVILEKFRALLAAELLAGRFSVGQILEFLIFFVDLNRQFFVENHNFIVAAARCPGDVIHHQTESIMDAYARSVNVIVPDLVCRPAASTLGPVELGIRQIVATYRDAAVFGWGAQSPNIDTLARLFMAIIQEDISIRPYKA